MGRFYEMVLRSLKWLIRFSRLEYDNEFGFKKKKIILNCVCKIKILRF